MPIKIAMFRAIPDVIARVHHVHVPEEVDVRWRALKIFVGERRLDQRAEPPRVLLVGRRERRGGQGVQPAQVGDAEIDDLEVLVVQLGGREQGSHPALRLLVGGQHQREIPVVCERERQPPRHAGVPQGQFGDERDLLGAGVVEAGLVGEQPETGAVGLELVEHGEAALVADAQEVRDGGPAALLHQRGRELVAPVVREQHFGEPRGQRSGVLLVELQEQRETFEIGMGRAEAVQQQEIERSGVRGPEQARLLLLGLVGGVQGVGGKSGGLALWVERRRISSHCRSRSFIQCRRRI